MKKLPKKFTVTITEEDRQNADRFSRNCSCILATAVRRQLSLAPEHEISEGVTHMYIGEVRYNHADFPEGPSDTIRNEASDEKPFYKPCVVGMEVTLTRAGA